MIFQPTASPGNRLLHLYLAAALIGLWLPPIRSRYRVVLTPPLLVLGAAFLAWLYETVRSRRLGRAVRAAALGLMIALVRLEPEGPEAERVRRLRARLAE